VKRFEQVSRSGNPIKSTEDFDGDSRGAIARAVRQALRPRAAARMAPGIAALMAVAVAAHAQNAVTDKEQTTGKYDKDRAILSEVVVTARRKAIESADQLKKYSESMIDSVLADDAGKLPDVSITEVLQRVPGVSISRWISGSDAFVAEGSGVQVRGLSDVAGRVNGREVFSANGGQGLSWTDVPPELMAGVDVYKAATADLIAGGTGGQINLRTKMPFDYQGLNAQASANEDYADFFRKASPTGSLLLDDTVQTAHLGKIGVLVDLSYGKYTSRADYISAEPFYETMVGGVNRYVAGGFNYGITEYWRTRKGGYAAFQWKPMDGVELSQTYWESKYTELNTGQAVFLNSHDLSVDPNGHNVIDAGGAVLASDSFYQFDPKQLGVSSGTVYTSGDTAVGRKAHDTRDLSTELDISPVGARWSLRASFQDVDADVNEVGYNVFPSIPLSPGKYGADFIGVGKIFVPASATAALADPSQYSYSATMDTAAINTAHMNAYGADYKLKLSDEGFFRSFQVGARYADHTESDSGAYNWQALGAGWNGYQPVSYANGRPGDYAPAVFQNFFQGMSSVPNVLLPSLSMVSRMDVLGDHELYGNPLKTTAQTNPTDIAHVRYTDTAIYALIRFASDKGIFNIPYSGNFGVRVVRTKHFSEGEYEQNSGSYVDPATGITYDLPQTTPVPLSGGRTDTEALPSLNLLFTPSQHWQTRFSYNMTMDRPDVSSIQANGTLGAQTTNISSNPSNQVNVLNGWNVTFGNPDLKPVVSHNFDLAEEWYGKPGSAAHISLFYKSIANWLVNSSTSRQWPVVFDEPTPTTQLVTVNYIGTYNSSQLAKIKGVEIGGHTYFDFLPGALRGFGIDANYTFIDSKNPGDQVTDIFGQIHHDLPIQGLSRHNANLALLYDYKWWSARLAYNWRSQFLLGSNIGGLNSSYDYFSASTPNASDAYCQSPSQSTCQYRKLQLPLYSPSYGQLDFGITLRPSDHYYISFQVANLTDQMTRSRQGGYPSGDLPRQWWISDRHYNLSVGVKL
jgi:TonB-dependent receptor